MVTHALTYSGAVWKSEQIAVHQLEPHFARLSSPLSVPVGCKGRNTLADSGASRVTTVTSSGRVRCGGLCGRPPAELLGSQPPAPWLLNTMSTLLKLH